MTRALPGLLTGALVLVLTVGTVIITAAHAGATTGLQPADWAALRFTLWQAALSALLSVALAVPAARALARRRFPGKRALVLLLGAPFILPVIVAVFGLIAVFGRGGLVNTVLAAVGVPPISIYGLHGVVLAHVFFNLPLAVRLILQGWLAIPAEQFRLAATLNLPIVKHIEWPMLRRVLPGVAMAIFLICLTSFAVALTLGGGPRATTLELAIYQALRFDFDLGRAALLAMLQFAVCLAAALAAWWVTPPDLAQRGLDRTVMRWDRAPLWVDAAVLVLVSLFLLLPLGAVVMRGVPGLAEMPASVWPAAARSLVIALLSTLLCVVMALSLGLRRGPVPTMIGALPLATSSLVMATGLFLLVFRVLSPATVAVPVTILTNAVLALPFALRSLAPEISALRANYDKLAATLGLSGWLYLRWLVLPRLRRPLAFAAGLAAALSMGDLGAIAIFADQTNPTLPLVMYRLIAAYQMTAAAGVGVLLLSLTLLVFWIIDRGGRHDVDA